MRYRTWDMGLNTKFIYVSYTPVLVHSHTAHKDIPKVGNIKKRGLIDSQFHMSGEASGNLESWQKVKQTCSSSRSGSKEKNESEVGEKPLIKPSDLVGTHLLSREQHGGNCPHDSITFHWVSPMTLEDYGNYNSR